MRILAVDTSGRIASAALIEDGACILERFADASRRHAETTLPLVESLLNEVGRGFSDMDFFAVDAGPGSFTGVRIGVSAVNAVAVAVGKPVIAVDSLRALYTGSPEEGRGVRTAVMIDARGGNAYAAQFENGACILAPDAVAAAEYRAAFPAGTVEIGDCGAGAERCPSARGVGLAAFQMTERAAAAASPIYLRPSQAERLFRERAEAKRA